MKFASLVDVFEELEQTTSGNRMRQILAQFFKKCPKKEIKHVSYLLLGTIASKFEDVDMGMAEKMVLRSISLDSGKSCREVKRVFKKTVQADTVVVRSTAVSCESIPQIHRCGRAY